MGTFKRLVKLSISVFVFTALSFRDAFRRWSGKTVPSQCMVLYYHDIPHQHRSRFAKQMDLLKSCSNVITLEDGTYLRAGRRYSAVTFDDGLESVLDNALPELKKRKIPAIIFVVVNRLGQPPHWGAYPPQAFLMSAAQLKSLPCDLITIGSHTLTHSPLTRLPEEEARREIFQSRTQLAQILNREIKFLSFPHGDFNRDIVRRCQEAGYERVFSISPVPAHLDAHEYVTGRVWVEPTDWLLEFRLKLLGAYAWLPWAFALKRRVFHTPQPGLPWERGRLARTAHLRRKNRNHQQVSAAGTPSGK